MDTIKNAGRAIRIMNVFIVPIKVAMNVFDIAVHLYSKKSPSTFLLNN